MERKEYDEDVIEYETNSFEKAQNDNLEEEEADEEFLEEVYEKQGFDGFQSMSNLPLVAFILQKDPQYIKALNNLGIDIQEKETKIDHGWTK